MINNNIEAIIENSGGCDDMLCEQCALHAGCNYNIMASFFGVMKLKDTEFSWKKWTFILAKDYKKRHK